MLPLALAATVKLTHGAKRFQVIQTAPTTLRVRLEVAPGVDDQQVSESVVRRLQNYLSAQGLPSIQIQRAPEPPLPDPISGKFRRVWAEEGATQAIETFPRHREKESE
jgi:hypothetical protein